jgi:ribulose-phosphate 3-epimerase
MFEVIPAINAENWETVKERIKIISPYTEWVHLDVADGTFTKNITWHNPEDLKSPDLPPNIHIETHLMIAEPEKKLQPWVKVGVRRVIIHWEALRPRGIFNLGFNKKIENISKFLKENWVDFGVSIIFKTDPKGLEPYIQFFDMIQILAVEPGFAGQTFNKDALSRISEVKRMIRMFKPQIKIEVDGGINKTNIKDCYIQGADIFAAASAIFGAVEPHLALEDLKKAILM